MSASQELEPGPSSLPAIDGERSAKKLAVQAVKREALGFIRAVGWGGSAPV